MGVVLPTELVWVPGAIGVTWPNIDEDGLHHAGDEFRKLSADLAADQCLAPRTPFEQGGGYDLDNFTAVGMAAALRRQSPAALRRRAEDERRWAGEGNAPR